MGISKQPPKRFPLADKGVACQLKWTHSTVYLTDGESASCHKAGFGKYEVKDGIMNFHNIQNKLEDRRKMLKGEWPGNGCEHCKHIEETPGAGKSDRQIHLQLENTTAPPELDTEPEAVAVTPRQVEVYWGNTCNQKCIYCDAHYSSQIHQEQKRFGRFDKDGVVMDYNNFKYNPNIEKDTEALFAWFEKNIHKLHKVFILGGEPFLQKETYRFIEFLESRELPDLTLSFFSNHNVEHERFKNWVGRLNKMVTEGRLDKLQIIASCDAWGPAGEYVRTGIDLPLLQKNFEYVLNETQTLQGINSALTVTAVPGMPELVRLINNWSKVRPVYWSMTKADNYHPNRAMHMYPGIFGKKINDWGLREAVELFDTNTDGYPDSVKTFPKEFMIGNMKEFENREPNIRGQKQFRTYLNELDRRRGTDWKKVYPQMWDLVKDL